MDRRRRPGARRPWPRRRGIGGGRTAGTAWLALACAGVGVPAAQAAGRAGTPTAGTEGVRAVEALPAPRPTGAALDALVREALSANRDLQRERLTLERTEAELQEASRLYLPKVSVHARYSRRSGNVTDLGRLINPAYEALNGLLGRATFPTDIELTLPLRQETSLRLTQPLLEPRILAARRVRAGQRDAQGGQLGAAERRVAADVRIGYLRYLQALRLEDLYDSTLVLVAEALRSQESFFENGQATPDQVLRARADRSEVEQQRLEARRLADAARESFNVLVGRPVEAPLERLSAEDLDLDLRISLDSALTHARLAREELAAARGGIRAARGQAALASAGYWPSIAAALEWGVQGEEYRLSADEDYAVASLVLEWTLFDGGQREARRRGARAELARAHTVADNAAEQIALDVRTSWQAAAVARDALSSARDRLDAARRTWELVARRHSHGAASLLELLDARTSFTAAAVNEALSTYAYAERCAELDRAAALYPVRSDQPGGDR